MSTRLLFAHQQRQQKLFNFCVVGIGFHSKYVGSPGYVMKRIIFYVTNAPSIYHILDVGEDNKYATSFIAALLNYIIIYRLVRLPSAFGLPSLRGPGGPKTKIIKKGKR